MVSGVVAEVDGAAGFGIFPSTYPVSPLDPSSCSMLMFHFIRFSPLNFCSLDNIVNEGVPDDISTSNDFVGYSIRKLLLFVLCHHFSFLSEVQ